MAVPTLPMIGASPSILFFAILELLAFVLVLVLLTAAAASMTLLIRLLLAQAHCKVFASKTPTQHRQTGYRRCTKTAFLLVGRLLCAHTFPALFKVHKAHSGDGRQMRTFMLFLDRKVENNLVLIAAFYSIVASIFCSSAMVFLRYFPVERSTECLEKDNHGRSLFCYSYGNSSLNNYSLPVDCASYSVTELRELEFDCYAISIPGLGIAVAAALGLAKVGIVGVTICVKITEGFFNMTKSPPQKLQEACCYSNVSRMRANMIYISICVAVLFNVSFIIFLSGLVFIVFHDGTETHLMELVYYSAYTILPWLICSPLMYVIFYLSTHCDKGEYASLAADQRPLHQRDWDEESGSSVTEGQQGEASRQGESGNINGEAPGETEEMNIEIYENNGSIE